MSNNISAIDVAIAKAKAAKAQREAASRGEAVTDAASFPLDGDDGEHVPASSKPSKEKKVATPKAEKVKPDNSEKVAAKAAKDADRAERKAKRDAIRDAKKAEKVEVAKSKGTPHMSKVLKAAEKLPALSVASAAVFTDVTTNFTRAQVAALAEHLMHFNRVQATNRALDKKIAVGDRVTIVGGPAKYLGQTGTISKSQRIRCYVTLDESDKEAYCFTSDVELLVEETEVLELAVGELGEK